MSSLKVQPLVLDLALYAGDGITVAFTFTDAEGAPWPTTGEWKAQVRATEVATDTITEFAIANDEANGVVLASLTGEQVRTAIVGTVYDLQQTPVGAEPRTWYRGKITGIEDVTRE